MLRLKDLIDVVKMWRAIPQMRDDSEKLKTYLDRLVKNCEECDDRVPNGSYNPCEDCGTREAIVELGGSDTT